MKFMADRSYWGKYTEAVGDDNPIHNSEDFAKRVGLEGVASPGMWLASHVPGKNIKSAKFRFLSPVFQGDVLNVHGSSIYRGEDLVCSGDVRYGKTFNGRVLSPNGFDYVTEFSFVDFEGYRDSIVGRGGNIAMYLMSLSGPTLLRYGKEDGLGGVHMSQSIEFFSSPELGDISVGVSVKRPGKRYSALDLCWFSDKEVIAKGESIVGHNFI